MLLFHPVPRPSQSLIHGRLADGLGALAGESAAHSSLYRKTRAASAMSAFESASEVSTGRRTSASFPAASIADWEPRAAGRQWLQ